MRVLILTLALLLAGCVKAPPGPPPVEGTVKVTMRDGTTRTFRATYIYPEQQMTVLRDLNYKTVAVLPFDAIVEKVQ